MSDRMKREMNKIDIPDELGEHSRRGVGKVLREKPVRNRPSSRVIAFVAALFLLIGGGIVTTISMQQQGEISSPESSSSSEDHATSEESAGTSESMSAEGMLYVDDRMYVMTEEREVERNETLGTVRERISSGEEPTRNFTSNVVDEGSTVYNTEEEGVLAVELPEGNVLIFIRGDMEK